MGDSLDNAIIDEKTEATSAKADHGSSTASPVNSLNEIVKRSNNPDAVKAKEAIDELRKERAKSVARIKECRRRLLYKENELVAVEKLVKMNQESGKSEEGNRRFGYLKRLKNRLEFRISTEASSLNQEKEIIRKISEINKELNDLGATVRVERKLKLVKGDIEMLKGEIAKLDPEIAEMDRKLDDMYIGLRKVLGLTRSAAPQQQKPRRPRMRDKDRAQEMPEINLQDIAVISKK